MTICVAMGKKYYDETSWIDWALYRIPEVPVVSDNLRCSQDCDIYSRHNPCERCEQVAVESYYIFDYIYKNEGHEWYGPWGSGPGRPFCEGAAYIVGRANKVLVTRRGGIDV